MHIMHIKLHVLSDLLTEKYAIMFLPRRHFISVSELWVGNFSGYGPQKFPQWNKKVPKCKVSHCTDRKLQYCYSQTFFWPRQFCHHGTLSPPAPNTTWMYRISTDTMLFYYVKRYRNIKCNYTVPFSSFRIRANRRSDLGINIWLQISN